MTFIHIMNSSIYLNVYLKQTHPDLQDIVLELRNIIASVASTATETVQWKGFRYYDKERGGLVSAVYPWLLPTGSRAAVKSVRLFAWGICDPSGCQQFLSPRLTALRSV